MKRFIAEETNLGLSTVRTIVGRINHTDRTTRKRWERIAIDNSELAHFKSRKRIGDTLPRRAQSVVETGNELVKEAKSLGRAKRGS